MMPRLDGFGLLRELRADPALRDLPVILLSARAGEEARVEGLEAGADDYLTKPFSARELIARVNANLEMARLRREATRELRESEARFRNMAENAPVMMWMTDQNGRVAYVNRRWSEFTGQAARRRHGLRRSGRRCTRRIERRRMRTFFEPPPPRDPFRAEYRLRRREGDLPLGVERRGSALRTMAEFHGYIGSVIDITERKEAEQRTAAGQRACWSSASRQPSPSRPRPRRSCARRKRWRRWAS